MKTILYTLCVLAVLCTSCKKEQDVTLSGANKLVTFSFQQTENSEVISTDLVCEVADSLVTGAQGTANSARTSLIANFTTTGVAVLVNGVPQVSGETINDFSSPVRYTIMAQDGSSHDYVVKLKAFSGIPILNITTEGPVTSKDIYVKGTLKVDGNMEYFDGLYDGKIEIKGRGNSTWYQDKKPYKIKLDKKSKLLGMPADKEWALLANYFDKSLLRNRVAFEVSSRFDMTYTPRSRFVEVFMNGNYLGNYLLTETIKVSPDRVNISTMDATNPNDTLGGFLTEVDARYDGITYFNSARAIPFVLNTPEIVTPTQLDYIQNYINKMEARMYSWDHNPVTGYAADFDLDKFVDWYILNELMLTVDASFYSSVYLYRQRGGKLSMGPVWDYDLSSGNVNYGHTSPEGWGLNGSAWIFMIVRDINFISKMKARWNQIKPKMYTLPAYIQEQADYLKWSQKENYTRWDVLGTFINPNQVVTGSYKGEVDYFKDWMQKRIQWMDAEINK